MKRILLTIAAFAILLAAANAQSTITENWPNGNKKTEGHILGKPVVINPGDSKEDLAGKERMVRDGKWTNWFENGTVRSEEFYKEGRMVGVWKTIYGNGQTESILDFTSGKAVFYNKNGVVNREGQIADGMIYLGKWIGYYENGAKNYEGSYNNAGQKEGVWSWWDEKGKLTTEQTFKDGEILNTKSND